MLDYRLTNGNERINLATEFVLKNIKSDDNILEIGCGIGIVTERIAKKVKNGFIWACDISDQNIWYAKQTVLNKNIEFFSADIFEQFDLLKKRINKLIDVFILIDVIEHLPKERHTELIQKLNSIASEDYTILLTFPSEYYQEYLVQNNSNELQIIDEIITLDHLLNLTKDNDLFIKYFEYKDVWMNNQYAHCIIKKKQNIAELSGNKSSHLIFKILGIFQRYFRRKKYIDKIFKESKCRKNI
ncbi:class I SAM-dependent methyltransferase [Ignavibacterium album]|uniref:class I SAM-dependent methyltransferase n=1 Tax=Ignavibacterium album TaxID=591197 RepID=UPI0038B3B272